MLKAGYLSYPFCPFFQLNTYLASSVMAMLRRLSAIVMVALGLSLSFGLGGTAHANADFALLAYLIPTDID